MFVTGETQVGGMCKQQDSWDACHECDDLKSDSGTSKGNRNPGTALKTLFILFTLVLHHLLLFHSRWEVINPRVYFQSLPFFSCKTLTIFCTRYYKANTRNNCKMSEVEFNLVTIYVGLTMPQKMVTNNNLYNQSWLTPVL